MTVLEERCRRTLEGSWTVGERDGVPFSYTRPSPGRYRWQWYWDSCFAAIAWRHFDPARSRAELETLLAAARPDGFIGHTIFWEHPVSGPRELYYNVIHRDDAMTATIQPPALAFAWRVAVGDPALEPRIVAHHERITAERDLEGDGLLWILQPDESGLDASPQFDPIWGHRAQGLPGFIELVKRNRERGFRIDAVRADGGPVVCEVLTNVIHGLSRLALGLPSITPALIARLYDERSGLFLPAVAPAITERIPLTWAALSPLALPDLPEEIGHRLVEYLLDERRFWTAVAPPAVSLDEPSFSLREHFDGLRRYWRGPRGSTAHGFCGGGWCASATSNRRPPSPGRSPKRWRGRGYASSTTRTTDAAWAPRTSPGPRLRSRCLTRETRMSACPHARADRAWRATPSRGSPTKALEAGRSDRQRSQSPPRHLTSSRHLPPP